MKTLLINPPRTYYPGSQGALIELPLGLLYVGAVLDKAGHHVEILDTFLRDLGFWREQDAIHCGMRWDRIREEIRARNPDVVGVSNPFYTQLDNAIRVTTIVKEVDPRIRTVMGGPHITVRAVETLRQAPSVDVAVVGEGEHTMLELIERWSAGNDEIDDVRGIVWRQEGKIQVNPLRPFIDDLNSLPFPAYHLVDMERYLNPRGLRHRETEYRRDIALITSRGCPFNCVFCSIHPHMGRKWRTHSEEYVVAHLEYVISKYKVNHIHFEDDNLTLIPKRFSLILDEVLAKGLKFTWDTPNGVRVEGLTTELLGKMKRTGCTSLTVGVESGDQHILDKVIDKHLRLGDVTDAAMRCKQTKIKLKAFYVIGFPGERKDDMQKTVQYALELKRRYSVDMLLHIATPLFGTRLYEICRSGGYLTQELSPRVLSEAFHTYGKGLISTEEFSPEDVKRIAAKAISLHSRLTQLERVKNRVRLSITHPLHALRLAKNLCEAKLRTSLSSD